MYKGFFHMEKDPFAIHPSLENYFKSKSYERVWPLLKESARAVEPFIMVSGEYGVGKTLLCLKLCQFLESRPESTFVMFPAPVSSYALLLDSVIKAFGIREFFRSCKTVAHLEGVLFSLFSSGKLKRKIVLICDDLQDYPRPMLLQLKRLCNFHVSGYYPFGIICLTHSNFIDELQKDPELVPFVERFRRHFRLQVLQNSELREYIYYRMLQAGARGRPLFDDDALMYIAEKSRGIPRLVHTLCDQILIEASALGTDQINLSLVKNAIDSSRSNMGSDNKTIEMGESVTAHKVAEAADDFDVESILNNRNVRSCETGRGRLPSTERKRGFSMFTLALVVNSCLLLVVLLFLFFREGYGPASPVQPLPTPVASTETRKAPADSIAAGSADNRLEIHQLEAFGDGRLGENVRIEQGERPFSLIVSTGNTFAEISEKIMQFRARDLQSLYVVEEKNNRHISRWSIGSGSFASEQEALKSSIRSVFPDAVVKYYPYSVLISKTDTREDVEEIEKMLLADGYFPWIEKSSNGQFRLLLGVYPTRVAALLRVREIRQEGIRAIVVRK